MFDTHSLLLAVPFALALWCLSIALAALFTMTEPDISDSSRDYRMGQCFGYLVAGVFFTAVFLALL